MSFSKMGKVFPKTGKVFPVDHEAQQYALVIAGALRDEVGNSHHAIKTVIRWTGASERTVKNWFAGTSGPSGQHLVALMRNSDDVFDALLVLSGREKTASPAVKKLIELGNKLREALQIAESMFDNS